jgi:hypothetical protein
MKEGNRFSNDSRNRFGIRALTTWTVGLLIFASICGCSSFNHAWKQAGLKPTPRNSIAGRWEGRWISDVNGHHGALRCLMTHDTNSTYRAWFRATYGGLLHFSYTARWEIQPHDIGWEFNGEADLGKLAGGAYYYEGRATTTNLISIYRSKYDHGRFELTRPK